MQRFEFTLQDGEEIVKEIKPTKRLILYFVLISLFRIGERDNPYRGPEIISA
ncbi:MAG: hypothetical protein QW609_03690 [Candidatus Aenigmatarchaeota archaeon]